MGLNIVLAMHCEEGHSNGSFTLAKRLRERGHRVTYLGLMDASKLVMAEGFEFVPFAEDILPEGALRESAANRRHWWQRRLASERLFAEFLRRFSNGHLDQRLLSTEPDVLLCDTCVWYVALRAVFLGIPTVNIATSLVSHPNPYIPPIVYSRIPKSSWMGRMQVRADWLWLRFQFVFTKRLASILLGRFRSPSRMHHLMDEFLKLARRSGIACKENRSYRFSEIGPRMVLPEIVLPPNSFDFPHTSGIGRRYLGDFVDLNRKEDASLLDELDPQKPLLYCSLGSAARYYPHSGHFFRTVVAASALRKDWQWVLSVGSQEVDRLSDMRSDLESNLASNIAIVKWAPQLSILQRAAVMVTHGGMNSIMECIHFRVPMVIVPGLRDQPGNMARAVHHGIALTAGMKDITPERLVKLIENAMHNADIRQALTRMKDRIAAESGMEAAVELIEAAGRLGPSDGSRCRGNGGWAKEATQPLNLSPDADDR
jgi:zeaxanthin glucosyltransferase